MINKTSEQKEDLKVINTECPVCRNECTGNILTVHCDSCNIFFIPRLNDKNLQIEQSKIILGRSKI